MPWQYIRPMDHKIHFISDYLRQSTSFSELCLRYNISRKTGYKLVKRYTAEGLDGLEERSRRPHSHPNQIPYKVRQTIINLRNSGTITLGAKKIESRLKTQFPDLRIPSISAINNILAQEGLVTKRKRRRRVARYQNPLKAPCKPNELWTTDFKGQFSLGNKVMCYPLTVMDNYSRFMIDCRAQESVAVLPTKQNFKKLFTKYGLPQRIRSDNGVPFATKGVAGLSALSIWWIRLGILPERIEPGKPQQNGCHERMHRTLKKYATRPASRSIQSQQKRFDVFCDEFNNQRPHESLEQKLPADVYQSSVRLMPKTLPDIDYESYMDVRRVRESGVIYWGGGQVYVSDHMGGEWIGFEEVDDGLFDIYFNFYRLGQIDIRNRGGKGTAYWTLKV